MQILYHSSQPHHKVAIIIVPIASWFQTWSSILIAVNGNSTLPVPQAKMQGSPLTPLSWTLHSLNSIFQNRIWLIYRIGSDYWPEPPSFLPGLLQEPPSRSRCSTFDSLQSVDRAILLRPKSDVTSGDFPGGPVVKTLCFHCRGRRFDPWSGN